MYTEAALHTADAEPLPEPSRPLAAHREREGTIQDRILRPLMEAGDLTAHDVESAYQAAAADRERRSAVFHLVEMGRVTADRALQTLGRVFGV